MVGVDEKPQVAMSTTGKQVKYRESCDSCLVAKVKCGKEKPICKRCLVNGCQCAYSPSLKTGRKRQNPSTRPDPQSKPAFQAPTSDPPSSNEAFGSSHLDLGSNDMTDLLKNGHNVFDDPGSNFLAHQQFLFEAANGAVMDVPVDESAGSVPFPPVTEPIQIDSPNQVDPFLPFFGEKDTFDPPPLNHEQVSAIAKGHDVPQYDGSISPFPSPLIQGHIAASLVQTPSSSDSSILDMQRLSCECFPICVQVLQSLHNQSGKFSTAQRDEHPSFDIILRSNAEALEKCMKVLKCAQCASDNGVMILATIIGKVISMYRMACGLMLRTPTHEEGKAQLAFGSYTLTGESRQLLEIEFLFLDLRKVTGVLVGFGQRYCKRTQHHTKEDDISNLLRLHLQHEFDELVSLIKGAKEDRAYRQI